MQLIQPFAGLRPSADRTGDVIAPPYDVLSSDEARERAAGRPWSFLHVSKPEIDLPAGTDQYSPAVYAKAVENLSRMIRDGIVVRDARPCYYVYRLVMGSHTQTGVVVAASLDAYDSGRIKRHEHTRPEKVEDRTRQIEALDAQTGPVSAVYPDSPAIDALLAAASAGTPDADAMTPEGIRHTLWVVPDPAIQQKITDAFEALPALYIADGHHRSEAAWRVASARRKAGRPSPPGGDRFLVVAFPRSQGKILDYNRVLRDINGLTPEALLDRIRERFTVTPAAAAVRPDRRGDFGLYVGGRWYRLSIRPDLAAPADPLERLDVSLLATHLIWPIFGIRDNGRDDRVDYVGGMRGTAELERRVDSGEMAAAISLHPTSLADVMAVADAGGIMPPKSTWFEPKLVDGLVSLMLG